MIRIPMVAVQKELFRVLTEYQTTPVYDVLDQDSIFPCITFGSFTAKNESAKNSADIANVTITLDIWSEHRGKMEINQIADNIALVLSRVDVDLSASEFHCLDQSVDFFEAFDEMEEGYHGVLTLSLIIQNTKEEE